jgi:hypothetical protein
LGVVDRDRERGVEVRQTNAMTNSPLFVSTHNYCARERRRPPRSIIKLAIKAAE